MSFQKYKRIFIIGHHGAGKALLAKALAEKLGWEFIDADLGLEARIGRFLSEIVGKPSGVEAFCQCQTEILNNQLEKKNIVVATDSSLLVTEKNKKLLSSEFVVYLKVSTSTQIERTSHHAVEPLLPVSDYANFLDMAHNERDSVYEKAASITIDSDENTLEKHVNGIIDVLEK